LSTQQIHADEIEFRAFDELLQEQVARVLHNNDLSEVEVSLSKPCRRRAGLARAELRNRLMDILVRSTGPRVIESNFEKLNAEYQTWQKDYDEWFKGATNGH
jgi:hypothetical protein